MSNVQCLNLLEINSPTFVHSNTIGWVLLTAMHVNSIDWPPPSAASFDGWMVSEGGAETRYQCL